METTTTRNNNAGNIVGDNSNNSNNSNSNSGKSPSVVGNFTTKVKSPLLKQAFLASKQKKLYRKGDEKEGVEVEGGSSGNGGQSLDDGCKKSPKQPNPSFVKLDGEFSKENMFQ